MKIGLTLPNRGLEFGVTTVPLMLEMAEAADGSDLIDGVWVGDSLLGKPRLDSIALLAAVSARTSRVRLGPACMASFPLRDPVQLAYQWASLDVLSAGRTVLIACTGLVTQEGAKVEASLYNGASHDRVQRLVEWIEILKRLWTEESVTFHGKQYQFEGVSIAPKPVQKPRPPIWIANNADGDANLIERTLLRVARHADGWQTSKSDYDDVAWRLETLRKKTREVGRGPAEIETQLYHNININENAEAGFDESKRFLDTYYMYEFDPKRVHSWVALGSPERCVEHLRRYEELGFDGITLRITSWDQRGQFKRLMEEVLPHLQNPVQVTMATTV
jgi:alkanesulfonate monooxygenase SsuD/methylene tetrahydromethanopterin reductase-like flavin-dependent oxidoreductase (luciferase family)